MEFVVATLIGAALAGVVYGALCTRRVAKRARPEQLHRSIVNVLREMKLAEDAARRTRRAMRLAENAARRAHTKPSVLLGNGRGLSDVSAVISSIGKVLGGEVGKEAIEQVQHAHQKRIADADEHDRRNLERWYLLLLTATAFLCAIDRIKHLGSRAFSTDKSGD